MKIEKGIGLRRLRSVSLLPPRRCRWSLHPHRRTRSLFKIYGLHFRLRLAPMLASDYLPRAFSLPWFAYHSAVSDSGFCQPRVASLRLRLHRDDLRFWSSSSVQSPLVNLRLGVFASRISSMLQSHFFAVSTVTMIKKGNLVEKLRYICIRILRFLLPSRFLIILFFFSFFGLRLCCASVLLIPIVVIICSSRFV